jgi:hypothetical protein
MQHILLGLPDLNENLNTGIQEASPYKRILSEIKSPFIWKHLSKIKTSSCTKMETLTASSTEQ